MPYYIKYQLEEGVTLLVEAPDDEEGEMVQASRRGGQPITDAKIRFDEALKDIMVQAKILIREIEELHVDESEIKFGLSTVGELGNFAIGKVGLGVNYEVSLKWKKPKSEKNPG
jgi:hypothetical protein